LGRGQQYLAAGGTFLLSATTNATVGTSSAGVSSISIFIVVVFRRTGDHGCPLRAIFFLLLLLLFVDGEMPVKAGLTPWRSPHACSTSCHTQHTKHSFARVWNLNCVVLANYKNCVAFSASFGFLSTT
jgi:hypothetical protein